MRNAVRPEPKPAKKQPTVALTESARGMGITTLGDLRALLRRVAEWPDNATFQAYSNPYTGDRTVITVTRDVS